VDNRSYQTRFLFRPVLTGLCQGWKKPGFLKKNQPSGFFWGFLGFFVLGFFRFFCPDERVFRVFFSSRILVGASRL